MEFGADVLKNVVTSLKTAEIGISTPLKSANCFRFVSQIGVDATAFLSRLQNLLKIGKEYCGRKTYSKPKPEFAHR